MKMGRLVSPWAKDGQRWLTSQLHTTLFFFAFMVAYMYGIILFNVGIRDFGRSMIYRAKMDPAWLP